MSIRDQVIIQRQNFEDALVGGGMPRAAAIVFANELTEFVALKYVGRQRAQLKQNVIAERQRLRNGEITRAQYDAWLASQSTEWGKLNPDGTIDFGNEG